MISLIKIIAVQPRGPQICALLEGGDEVPVNQFADNVNPGSEYEYGTDGKYHLAKKQVVAPPSEVCGV